MTATVPELVRLKNYLAQMNEDLKHLMATEGCQIPICEKGDWDLPKRVWLHVDDMKRLAKEYRLKRGCPAVSQLNFEYPYDVRTILEAKEI
jgi:hypothetical protein